MKSSLLKIIGINLSIFILIIIAPGVIWKMNWLKDRNSEGSGDPRLDYNVAKDRDINAKVWAEYKQLPYTYRSFIGWRRDHANLKYTNISGKYNTRNSSGQNINNSNWFFGGSTIWGTGVTDMQTVPSQFNKITGESVMNFGESGWNSRQSLNLLMNLLGDNNKPKRIIFYDGINDTQGQCRSEIKKIPSNSKEVRIAKKLKATPEILFRNKSINFIVRPYTGIYNYFSKKEKLVTDEMYNCDNDQLKAKYIINHLINNWEMAYDLAKKNNVDFIAILHPHAFNYNGETDYLRGELNPEQRKQLDIIYSGIKTYFNTNCKVKSDFCKSFYDGSNWINERTKDKIFLDNVHLNSVGNNYVAEEIHNIIINLENK